MTADDARARAIEATVLATVRELGAWDDLAKAMRLIPSDVAAAVLDVVAPIFEAEADRRVDHIILIGEGIADRRVDRARRDLLADLRAKVSKWRDYAEANERTGYMRDEHRVGQVYAYERVVDLLDEVQP